MSNNNEHPVGSAGAYEAPRLTVLGYVHTLTLGVKAVGESDGWYLQGTGQGLMTVSG